LPIILTFTPKNKEEFYLMKHFIYASLFLLASFAQAQQNYWQSDGTEQTDKLKKSATSYQLDLDQFKQALYSASESTIQMPNANGDLTTYKVKEFSNFSEGLSAKYPSIKSYRGTALNKAGSTVSISISNDHIQALIMSAEKGTFIVEQAEKNTNNYLFYSKNQINAGEEVKCLNEMADITSEGNTTSLDTDDNTLRTYELVATVDGEFSQFHGGTMESSLAAINDLLAFINPIYERDLAIHLELIDNNDDLVFLDPDTDPYTVQGTGVNATVDLSSQVQSVITDSIGESNYDLGIIFSPQVQGGFSGCISCVCANGFKGGAVAGPTSGGPEGFAYAMIIAHEMGHQFGANHTFSRDEGTNASQEPGSGTTIMAYAGATQFYDVQPASDGMFQHYSIQQISNYVVTTNCATEEELNNSTPSVDAGSDYTIPSGTAFKLEADASDPDAGDELTYSWEQANDNDDQLGSYHFPSPTSYSSPNYRVFLPTTDSFRYFPKFDAVLNGSLFKQWEMTPTVARSLDFVVEVRDNNSEGGQTASDDMEVYVLGNAGPFQVSSIEEFDGFELGETHNLEWDVSGTNSAPINAANVNILLSTDAGENFDTIVQNTANDGEEEITMPNMDVDEAYILVEAANNIFYAASPAFSIGSKISLDCADYSSDSPVDISSINGQPTPIVINVSDQGTIEDLEIQFELENTVINDLLIVAGTPFDPQGKVVYFPNPDCSTGAASDYNITFDSEGNSPYAFCGELDGKNVQPLLLDLSEYNGQNRAGTYQFIVYRINGAPSGSVNSVTLNFCDKEQVNLSVEDKTAANEFKVYPNPSSGTVNISTEGFTGETDLSVFSITGKKVFEKSYKTMRQNTSINLSNLATGVYLMKVNNGDKTSVKKIVIE
jgi:hypothetical protein